MFSLFNFIDIYLTKRVLSKSRKSTVFSVFALEHREICERTRSPCNQFSCSEKIWMEKWYLNAEALH